MIDIGMVTTLGLSVASAALCYKPTRKILLGDMKHDWLADQYELENINLDGITVLTKSGLRTRFILIEGINYDAKTPSAQDQQLMLRSAANQHLGKAGIGVRYHAIKRIKSYEYNAEWPCVTLEEIGAAEKTHHENAYDILYVAQVTGNKTGPYDEPLNTFFSTLSEYKPRYLEKSETGQCELSMFINGLMTGEFATPLSAVSNSISQNLPASGFFADAKSGLIITNTPTQKFHRIISIQLWPESVSGLVQHEILSLPGDIEITQICLPLSKTTEETKQGRRLNELSGQIPYTNMTLGSESEIQETIAILDILKEDKDTFFNTQYQIMLRGDSVDELNLLTRRVTDILGRSLIRYYVEDLGVGICWFNRIAGNNRLMHPLKMFNNAIGALWPFHRTAQGMDKGPHGDLPLRLLSTPSGQTYKFQFHFENKRQALGNFCVFAPAGSGKSTLIMHLLSGAAKFPDVANFMLDSNEGAKYMVEAMGGIYMDYENIQFNPLDLEEDNQTNRNRINFIVKAMLGEFEEDGMDTAINHLIDLAFHLDRGQRTFDALFDHAFERKSKLKERFGMWVRDGLQHHVFNAPYDTLKSTLTGSHLIGINMNEVLSDPVLGPPVVTHISEAIRAVGRKKRGFNLFVDEAANLIQNQGFKTFVMEMFREYRKLDGCVGLAFQDPFALFESGISQPVLANTATKIFFPNANADPESLRQFNFNEEQMDFAMGGPASKGGRRIMVVKKDAATGVDESTIVDVDLSPLGDALRFYRAGTEANQHLETVKKARGAEWLSHV
ncbi:VirB4 family type IV secretion system protein [Terasakiella pusilla]|uniref:VirB4 family type IV secretion system protein n=1 Tax=Terasakiella pusilla TaxID=64973 RepID=UPI003AA87FB4